MSVESDIHHIFITKGYTWRVDDKDFAPSVEQIREHIDKMKAAVEDDEQITSGRLVIMRTNNTYDIFVMIGEETGETE